MFLRIDKLQFDLPLPKEANPNGAATVQELMGGRFGEMSTMMNYMTQSFNFRGKDTLRPYYELIANIAAEELGHIELVSAAINSLLAGPDPKAQEEPVDPATHPFSFAQDVRNTKHFIGAGPGTLIADSHGKAWTGDYVYSSGNLMLDLTHNFFLEGAARHNKLRVYEMVDDPTAKALVGYLLVRGGVHQIAYGKALESLTGVTINKMLPMPNIPTAKIPEARAVMDRGLHQILYRFSDTDYKELGQIWNGTHPEDGSEVRVGEYTEIEGGDLVDGGHDSAAFSPDWDMGEIMEIAQKLHDKARLR
ncbi:manganese catalase family protein [Deinococcus sp. HMF7620]|uniref:Manganese catalase family protein n=1 Tax=Deinococcus arboris TaxID=2682977 RepID=A0A7C9LNL7_9DEIO|nr:manganese catalase family protein [Deinococcus arboris]MVN89078.1 manganese catalase family protein [Deinococcus arboris]